jgi:hypothetical protein
VRRTVATLGTIAVIGIMSVHCVAARGGGQRLDHAQPGEGALVLPLAAGDRHRHDHPHRLVHAERGVRGRRAAAGVARRAADGPPWLDKSSHLATGVWLPRVRARQNTVFLLVVLGILILTFIGMALRGPYWNFYWPWEAWPDIPARI